MSTDPVPRGIDSPSTHPIPRGSDSRSTNPVPSGSDSLFTNSVPAVSDSMSTDPIPSGIDSPSTNPIATGSDSPSSNPIPTGADSRSTNPVPTGSDSPSSHPVPTGTDSPSTNPIPTGSDSPSTNSVLTVSDSPSTNPVQTGSDSPSTNTIPTGSDSPSINPVPTHHSSDLTHQRSLIRSDHSGVSSSGFSYSRSGTSTQSHRTLLSSIAGTFISSDTFTGDPNHAGGRGQGKVSSSALSSVIWAIIGVFLILIILGLLFFVWKSRHDQMDQGDNSSEGTELSFETDREGGETTFDDELTTAGSEYADLSDGHFGFFDAGDAFQTEQSLEEGLFLF
jgi:hypothetical protein